MNLKDVIQQRSADQMPVNGEQGKDDEAGGSDLSAGGERRGKPERAMATLGRGRSVIVTGCELTLDSWIKTVQEALAKARRAKTYGLQLDSFLKMLRDMSRD